MAEVIRTSRRGRIWPSFVMLLIVLLLIGIVIAMIMNLRGSISWPAGRIEFGFRPNIYVTKTEPVNAGAPSRLAIDIGSDPPARTSSVPAEIDSTPVPDTAPEQTPPQPADAAPQTTPDTPPE
jgi:hypothetical protein